MAGRFLQRVRNNSNNHRLGKFIKLNNEQYLFKDPYLRCTAKKVISSRPSRRMFRCASLYGFTNRFYWLEIIAVVIIRNVRGSHQRCSVKKRVLKIFSKFRGKQLCQILFFNIVASLRPATLLKMRLCYRCFPVNLAKFLGTHVIIIIIIIITTKPRHIISSVNKNQIYSTYPIFYLCSTSFWRTLPPFSSLHH